jgi:hypothetical protein
MPWISPLVVEKRLGVWAMLHAPTESQLARQRGVTSTSRIKIQQAQLARIRQSKLRTYRSFGRLLSVSHTAPTALSRDVAGSHGSISKEAPGSGNHLVIYSPALYQTIDRSPAVRPTTAPTRVLATRTAERSAKPRRPMSPTERDLSALQTRRGEPLWDRGGVPFGSLYNRAEEGKRGSFGPGGYDVYAISRTGTPRGHMTGNSAHAFGPAPATMRRAASANQYEGRELASKKLGSYGPGGYDVMRISRTGTPRGHARGIPVFGAPADKTRPESAPYRIGSSDPDRLAQTALPGGTRYTGKDAETAEDPCKAQLGLFGAGECRGAHIAAWDRPSGTAAACCCGALAVLCTSSICLSSTPADGTRFHEHRWAVLRRARRLAHGHAARPRKGRGPGLW